MKDKISVLIFDSGVGGFSIYEPIRTILGEDIILHYFSDQEFFPYGTKSESLVIERVLKVACHEKIQDCYDIFVVACNTASTVALKALRERVTQPVVGVVPAIKPAASKTQSSMITLLATPATIARPYTMELIESFAPSCDVLRVGSQKLVELAERFLLRREDSLGEDFSQEIRQELRAAFHKIDMRRTDVIVLGCTHFPLLLEYFKELAPWDVTFMDSGAAVSSRVRSLVDEYSNNKVLSEGLSKRRRSMQDATLFVSGFGTYGEHNWRKLQLKFGLKNFEKIIL